MNDSFGAFCHCNFDFGQAGQFFVEQGLPFAKRGCKRLHRWAVERVWLQLLELWAVDLMQAHLVSLLDLIAKVVARDIVIFASCCLSYCLILMAATNGSGFIIAHKFWHLSRWRWCQASALRSTVWYHSVFTIPASLWQFSTRYRRWLLFLQIHKIFDSIRCRCQIITHSTRWRWTAFANRCQGWACASDAPLLIDGLHGLARNAPAVVVLAAIGIRIIFHHGSSLFCLPQVRH